MLKAVMVAGVACAIATGVTAQNTPWQAGVTGGLAMTNVSADDLEGNDSKMSPFFGLSVVYQPAGPLGFETGAIYISKGFSMSDDGFDADFNIKYIEVPLLVRYALTLSGSQIRPVFMAGAAVGLNTGCTVEGEAEGVSASVDCDEGDFIEIKGLDVGVAARAGVDIPAGQRAIISPTLRYTHGLTNIVADAEEGGDDAKNTAFVFGVSVRIRL